MKVQQQDILKLVGRNIQLARIARNLSLTAFATLVGIDKAEISWMEAGKIDIHLTALDKICISLAIPVEILFTERLNDWDLPECNNNCR